MVPVLTFPNSYFLKYVEEKKMTKPGALVGASLSEPHTHETASPVIYLSLYICIYVSYAIP